MKNSLKLMSLLFLFSSFSNLLLAGGFQIYQAGSPEAKALGAAVVARDDLISAAWYNPAAVMDYDKKQYSSGYSFAWINQEYEPGNGLPTMKKKDKMYIIPNSHYIHPVNEKYTAVVSLYAPYGLGMQWNDDEVKRLADTGLYNDRLIAPGQMLVKGLPTQVDLQVPYLNLGLSTKAVESFQFLVG